MSSRKLDPLVFLIKKHGTIKSINKLAKFAGKDGDDICTRATIFNLLSDLKRHESIRHKEVNGADTFTYIEVTEKRNFTLTHELDLADSEIESYNLVIKSIKQLGKKKFPVNMKGDLLKTGVDTKRSIARIQQKLIHFEACGFVTRSLKERFDFTKEKLAKIDLDLHRTIYKTDPETSGEVWTRIDYEHTPKAFIVKLGNVNPIIQK